PRIPGLVCGDVHPENWGKLFHRHYPNHGFVGDIFTVNGTAFPVLHAEARRYRFRFLGASVSRQYKLRLMTGTPMPFPGKQGQWLFGKIAGGKQVTAAGTQVAQWTQIAIGGGLLPNSILQDELEVWPAQRRGGLGGETEWLINGAQFDPTKPLATPFVGSGETWGVNNGGGGWTHPMHLHMEEHHITYRSSDPRKYADHKGDTGKDDVISLEGS